MKKTMTYLLLLAGILLLAGCQKEGGISVGKGEIRFVASARPETKTVYGGYFKPDPNDDEKWVDANPADAAWQSIDWVAGDEIRIYSDKAVRRVGFESGAAADALYHWADYSLTNVTAGTANTEDGWSSATLVNMSNDGTGDPYDQEKVGDAYHVGNGLMWPDADPAKFYAVYPRLRLISGIPEDEGTAATPPDEDDDPYQYALLGVSGKFPLLMPDSQRFSEKGNLSEYGYMTAMGSGKASDDKVTLEFSPDFSAFEISVKSAGDPIGLKKFELISAGKSLAGEYVVDYSSGTKSYTFPTSGGKTITVNLNGLSADTDYLTFTVLALPQEYNDLSVRFTTSQDVTRTLALKYADPATGTPGANVPFAAGVKHRIYGLALPNGELLISVGTAPWDEVDPSTYTTIEDASTMFDTYQAYLNGQPLWKDTYVAVAPGYITGHLVPDDPESPVVSYPKNSTMFTLTTISVGVELRLVSDNPKVGFVYRVGEGYSEPVPSITIPASTVTDEFPYGTRNETVYFVYPMDGAVDGDVANISLIRTDCNAPIAYSHQNLPASTDHTKVRFMVVTPEKYLKDTETRHNEI